MIFIPFIVVAVVAGCYFLYYSNEKNDENIDRMCLSFTVFIFSMAFILAFGIAAILVNFDIGTDTKKEEVETKYMLLQYRIRDYNDLTTEEKVDFLLTDTLVADVEKWNTSRKNYERNRNNIWIGFLLTDRYENTDYINILGDNR